jgi:hypothetical protein
VAVPLPQKREGYLFFLCSCKAQEDGLKFKAGTPETKEFNLGHTKQVFLSTEGSCTSAKFELLFYVEEQQQGEVIAKYISNNKNIYRNTSIWVPKILVTNMQGPKNV